MKAQKPFPAVPQNFWWVALIVISLLAGIAVWRFFDYKIEKIKYEGYFNQITGN